MVFPLNARRLVYLLVLVCVVMAPASHAAVLTVTSTADTTDAADGYCTLREAITVELDDPPDDDSDQDDAS